MKISRLVKLALAFGCCFVLAPMVDANPGNGNSSHGKGNPAFGKAQGMNPQIGSGKSKTAHGGKRKRKAKSRKTETARRTRTKHGNSAFGHRQGDPSTRTTGSQNNAYGKATSAEAHAKHDGDKTTAPGNSAFGHQQGDAATRTTGSQNNSYEKKKSAEAHAKHDGDDDEANAPAPSPGQ